MFLAIFTVLFMGASSRELSEPKFRVLTPDELMVEVPHYEDMELVTFRIGVRRKDNELEDLELGENVMNNNRIFIYDERLDLKRDDVVNYLLAFKDKEGYQAQTGKYVFDGDYFKKSFGRRHRFQRSISSTTEATEEGTEASESSTEETEGVNIESRFGYHHHHGGQWPGHNGGYNPFRPGHGRPHGYPGRGPPNQYPGGGPNNFYPGHGPTNFYPGNDPSNFNPGNPFIPNYPQPQPGGNCNDHSHDMCHQRDVERWEKSTTKPSFDNDYHCRMCHGNQPGRQEIPTRRPVFRTTTEFADIDIRFSKD